MGITKLEETTKALRCTFPKHSLNGIAKENNFIVRKRNLEVLPFYLWSERRRLQRRAFTSRLIIELLRRRYFEAYASRGRSRKNPTEDPAGRSFLRRLKRCPRKASACSGIYISSKNLGSFFVMSKLTEGSKFRKENERNGQVLLLDGYGDRPRTIGVRGVDKFDMIEMKERVFLFWVILSGFCDIMMYIC
ncbi:hypothetical protein [Alteribacter salitolerans]|uniref:hypothetical protein n=1 Tax=Alteribacter salitolerans TaxID=2912333 RepID=UPI001965533E|nr:hypothetical protein [Alteribacter salitolerans]